MTTLVQFRVDKELKREAENLFKDMGLDLSTALKLFLKQCVNQRKIPFAIITTANDESYGNSNAADNIDSKNIVTNKI